MREAMTARILVADDSRCERERLSALLRREGFEVLQAPDGDAAVARVRDGRPDLVLSDVWMPGRDGFALCRALKADARTAGIPVIFLSGRGRPADRVQGLELGASDYIVKPYDRGEVLARVRAHLRSLADARAMHAAHRELALRNHRFEEALAAAATIQQSLIPRRAPPVPGVSVAWRFLPCESVGGDMFNVVRLDPRTLGFYVLDVCGHGVPAAMVTVSVSQALAPAAGITKRVPGPEGRPYRVGAPCEVIEALDREYPFARFARHFTICYALLDIETGELRYANAGHPAPMVAAAGGGLRTLDEGGTIVGLGLAAQAREGRTRLAPGDRLLVFTDGLLEQRDAAGEWFGSKRLGEELEATRELPLDAACERIAEAAAAHAADGTPRDDVTLLGVEMGEEG